jgi:hypothetical protein
LCGSFWRQNKGATSMAAPFYTSASSILIVILVLIIAGAGA